MERKKHKNKKGKAIILVLVSILLLIAAICIAFVYSDINGKFRGDEEVSVKIEQGMGPLAIGKVLQENKVIRSAQLFRFYVKASGDASMLQYGDFGLTTDMSYAKIVETLKATKQKKDSIRVTFPEGSTVVQFAQKLEAAGLCSAKEFIDTANTADFSQFAFWGKISDNPMRFMKAEGYLFPETYDFFKDDTPYKIAEKLYAHFDERITPEYYTRMEEMDMSLDELITLASIVQEEAGPVEEQPHVASVLLNRLKPGSPLPGLQCNVSSYIREPGNYVNDYIIPYYGGKEYIPEGMFDAYDTYKILGLPAGPISCPGIDAIKNTLYPKCPDGDECPHYYFVTDLAGKYYYSSTLNEHNNNIAITKKVNASLGK
ncbi:MAG: endolytic transglycosylase MltG [Oscillospiraceae bacterium]